MIRIKLRNWNKGRNIQTFRPFVLHTSLFYQAGIQFVEEGDCDFEFIGMEDFINKKLPLSESISKGLELLATIEKPYFLFDGSDSTSLMGAYEVFTQSQAIHLYKNQLLSREEYKNKTAFNKWFFGTGTSLDLSYDILEKDYEKIKLSGWNLGYHHPQYLNFTPNNLSKDIDVCAIYQGYHVENSDHHVRNDLLYTSHRVSAWETLSKSSRNVVTDKKPYSEYVDILSRSKVAISPFGMGEICFRDFEIVHYGTVMIKPDMSRIITEPNLYVPYETYIPCKPDWSDLLDVVEEVLTNWDKYEPIAKKAQQRLLENFSPSRLVEYWKDRLLSYPGVIRFT